MKYVPKHIFCSGGATGEFKRESLVNEILYNNKLNIFNEQYRAFMNELFSTCKGDAGIFIPSLLCLRDILSKLDESMLNNDFLEQLKNNPYILYRSRSDTGSITAFFTSEHLVKCDIENSRLNPRESLNTKQIFILSNSINIIHEINRYHKNDDYKVKYMFITRGSEYGIPFCNAFFSKKNVIGYFYECIEDVQENTDNAVINARLRNITRIISHEMGHSIYHYIIQEQPQKRWEWESIFIDYHLFGRFLRPANPLKVYFNLLDDSKFTGFGGHTQDANELFASTTMEYRLYGDKLARVIKSIKDPSLRESPFKEIIERIPESEHEKLYQTLVKIWRFHRDFTFNGKVFTSDGKDPFP